MEHVVTEINGVAIEGELNFDKLSFSFSFGHAEEVGGAKEVFPTLFAVADYMQMTERKLVETIIMHECGFEYMELLDMDYRDVN